LLRVAAVGASEEKRRPNRDWDGSKAHTGQACLIDLATGNSPSCPEFAYPEFACPDSFSPYQEVWKAERKLVGARHWQDNPRGRDGFHQRRQVAAHPEYHREEEPYRALSLDGPYEIRFRDASTRLPNGIQMYYSISRVHRYSAPTTDVIFDRAPVDSIAYSLYTANQRTTDIDLAFVETLSQLQLAIDTVSNCRQRPSSE
jgi:hypothetical protein